MPTEKAKTQPEISVAVVTFNQAHFLELFLGRYLKAHGELSAAIPLLIIDDGSSDQTHNILKATAAESGCLSFLSKPHQGIAAARNAALLASKTPWLAFIDTDCLPAVDYLERLLEIPLRFAGAAAVEGAVISYPPGMAAGFCHTMENVSGGMYATANMAFHVKSALEAGGFDEQFGNYREDVDLGLRLNRKFPIPFWEALKVMHPHIPLDFRHSLTRAWPRYRRIIHAEIRLYEKHPADYAKVRAHSSAKATLKAWKTLHLIYSLKAFSALRRTQVQGAEKQFAEFRRLIPDFFKTVTTAIWEQVCINVLCLGRGFSRRLNSPNERRQNAKHSGCKKLLVIWIGGVVPSYRYFFKELGHMTELCLLTPRQWKHGSKISRLSPDYSAQSNYKLVPTVFYPSQSSKYLIPLLPFYLWRLRPDCIYLMDEIDRLNTMAHVFFMRLCRPRALVVTYSLQNLQRPSYYRFYHRLALKINCLLVHRIIAASREAEKVLQCHGFKKATTVTPLGVSPEFFYPAEEKAALRRQYGIKGKSIVLIYAGSLAREKGIGLVASLLSEIPGLMLLAAGQGPLENELRQLPEGKIRLCGALDGEQLRACYQISDFVILPSTTTPDWQEQIGRSLLEGILCGCAAVGCRSGFIPEITLLPETLFVENDLAVLKGFLNSLKGLNRQAIHEKQLKHLMGHFTWKAVAGRTYRFISGGLS